MRPSTFPIGRSGRRLITGALLALGSWLLVRLAAAAPAPMIRFDFTRAQEVAAWTIAHDVRSLKAAPEGMAIQINGDDPYLTGPRRDYPPGQPLWLRIRLRAPVAGMTGVQAEAFDTP